MYNKTHISMDNNEKELALSKLVESTLRNCCEYLYSAAGLSAKDAEIQGKIKAATIQNDILRDAVKAKSEQNEPVSLSGGARRTDPDAELPLIEEAQIVKDPVKEQEAEELFKEFGAPDQSSNSKDGESVEDLVNQLQKSQGSGDGFTISGV